MPRLLSPEAGLDTYKIGNPLLDILGRQRFRDACATLRARVPRAGSSVSYE
jgi:hypothetical protein